MTKINNDAPISINVEIPERVRSLLSDERFVVILLLMIGLAMRIFNISYQSIGLDEGSTFWYSHYTWSEFFDANEPNSPVYYIMEGYILDALGQNEFALRISSAISGALCVPLTYYLIKKVTGVYPVAVFAAVLIMVSPSCLYYSQEARGYSLVMFFFLLQALMRHILQSFQALNKDIRLHSIVGVVLPLLLLPKITELQSPNQPNQLWRITNLLVGLTTLLVIKRFLGH